MVNKNGKMNAARLKTPAHSKMSVGRTSAIGSRVGIPNKVNAPVDNLEAKYPDSKFPPRTVK